MSEKGRRELSSNIIILSFIHVLVVIATCILNYSSGVDNWYLMSIIILPLLLGYTRHIEFIKKYRFTKILSEISYTVNFRILLPISVGIFYVSFYHYFPTIFLDNAATQLSTHGITNPDTGKFAQKFFEVNEIFTDAVTVLYAVCSAFLLWKGLNDHDELKNVLYEEANEINAAINYLSYFSSSNENIKTSDRIYEKLLTYVDNYLEGDKVVANSANDQVLKDCFAEIGNLD